MYRYGQYCPVARAAEILGDRWTLLILRDLLLGVQRFNDLERGLPGIPRAVLSERLRRLQAAGILERQVGMKRQHITYQPTQAGLELQPLIDVLTHWGARWAFGEPEIDELDPVLLMWWMRDRIYTELLPAGRIVVEFDFRGPRRGRYWLLLESQSAAVCQSHPGFDIDIMVKADLGTFYKVWLGRMAYADAVRDEQIEVDAVPALIRAFPQWFAWSPVANTVRAAEGQKRLMEQAS